MSVHLYYQLLFSLCRNDEDEETTAVTPEPKFTNAEQTHMIHLRRYLDHLAEKVEEKQHILDKTREELKKCMDQTKCLSQERDETFTEMQNAHNAGNV